MKVITDYFSPPPTHSKKAKATGNEKDESVFSDENSGIHYETRKIKIRLADPTVPDSYVCEVYDTSLDETSPVTDIAPIAAEMIRRTEIFMKKKVEDNKKVVPDKPSAFDVLMAGKKSKPLKKRTRPRKEKVNLNEDSDSDDEALVLVKKKLKASEEVSEPKKPKNQPERSLRPRRRSSDVLRLANPEQKEDRSVDSGGSRNKPKTLNPNNLKAVNTKTRKVSKAKIVKEPEDSAGASSEDSSDSDLLINVQKNVKLAKKIEVPKNKDGGGECQVVLEKLAPLFVKKKKPEVDLTLEKAKAAFLQSGLPTCMRREAETIKAQETKEISFFPLISHVQQKSENYLWDVRKADLKLQPKVEYRLETMKWTRFTDLGSSDKETRKTEVKKAKIDDELIGKLKKVYGMVKIEEMLGKLKARKEVGETSVWSEKYKTGSAGILSNERTVLKLRKWLAEWKASGNEKKKRKVPQKADAGSSDDFVTSDYEIDAGPLTACLIQGPASSGKSTLVHALAAEMDFNVLEVNSSAKRSGKKMLADLQEATKSHNILQEASGSLSQSSKDRMSVIVVEEADVVFDQDEGYVSGLLNLVLTAKRPVILLTSDPSSPHLEKFRGPSQALQLTMVRPRVACACAVLELVSLLEGVAPPRCTLYRILSRNNCDLRRSLLEIQFWFDYGGGDFSALNAACLNSSALWKASQAAFFKEDLQPGSSKISAKQQKPSKEFILNFLQFSENLSFCDLLEGKEGAVFESGLNYNQCRIKDSCSLDEDLEVRPSSAQVRLQREINEYVLEGAARRLRPYLSLEKSTKNKDPLEVSWIPNRKKASEELVQMIGSATNSKATYADYLPMLRSICRQEGLRAASNTKRTNRFYHYLRSIGLNPTDANLEINRNALCCTVEKQT